MLALGSQLFVYFDTYSQSELTDNLLKPKLSISLMGLYVNFTKFDHMLYRVDQESILTRNKSRKF